MIEVEIEDAAWTDALPEAEAVVTRAAEAALSSPGAKRAGEGDPAQHGGGGSRSADPTSEASVQSGPLHHPSGGPPTPFPLVTGEEITVLLTSDDIVADLNARFRSKTGPTNVLSFPAPETARPHLGDIALAYGVCAREAAGQGKNLEHHLTHLVAHGVLHLLGYDHQTDGEAEDMEARERAILSGLGVPDPYADRAA